MTDQHWTRTGGKTWRVHIGPSPSTVEMALASLAQQTPLHWLQLRTQLAMQAKNCPPPVYTRDLNSLSSQIED